MKGSIRVRVRLELDGDALADEVHERDLDESLPWGQLFADVVDVARRGRDEFYRRHPAHDVTDSSAETLLDQTKGKQ